MSPEREFKITDARGGAAFPVKVVTRAESTEMVGLQGGGMIKIRLTASSAGDQEANDELIAFLAEQLNVEPGRIEIVAGENKRDKIVSVEGITTDDIEAMLGAV